MKNSILRAIALLLILLSASVFAVSCKDKKDDEKDKEPSSNDGGTGDDGNGDGNIFDENGNMNGGGYTGEWDTEF